MRLGKIEKKTAKYVLGSLKGYTIEIERIGKKDPFTEEYQFNITCRHKNGGYVYDGYWHGKSMNDAIAEAIKGSCIKNPIQNGN